MILELRLSNLFSLRDEASLNLQAAKIQTEKGRALQGNLFTVGGEQFLKSVAVFVDSGSVLVISILISRNKNERSKA